jgi:hypothetical protein
MMQPYKGYFIEGNALLVHPFSPDWYVCGSVLVSGRSSSIVEVTRFQLHQVHRELQRTGGMVRAGSCEDRGGRMPGSARELNG